MENKFQCCIVLCVLLLIGIFPAVAQEDDSCATVVLQALETVDATCEDTVRNQACYGNSLIEAELQPDAEAEFTAVGDLAPVAEISRLHTAPIDLDTGDWGVALMKIQANLPDTLPGQNVTFLLTGDVTLTDASEDDDTAPMQSFYFTAGIGESACQNAPNDLVIQSPQGTQVALTVNGVDINLGSTAVFEITAEGAMDVLLVGGSSEVTALDASESVPAGQVTTIALDDEGLAAAPPTSAAAFDPGRIQHIPFELLPETVQVPSIEPWVDTGITLQAGQTFVISASGMVNTHALDDEFAWANVWNTPPGLIPGDNCPIELGEYKPNCLCRNDAGECPLVGAPLMALIGRIGDGQSFLVGTGGTFTASTAGMLLLAVNDDGLGDNAGAFTAIITILDESMGGETATLASSCIVTTNKTVNLRSGPGTNYAVAGQLSGSAQVVGQAMGADGFVWWSLADASWVRSDVVSESENCNNVPVVSVP